MSNEFNYGFELYDFKNSIHYGQYTSLRDQEQPKQQKKRRVTFSDEKNNEFALNTPKITQRHRIPDIQKRSIQGFGLTIDDKGILILAQWRHGKINGKYFMFNPHGSGIEINRHYPSGICYYGSMKNGVLQNQNYIWTLQNTAAKGYFENGKINGKCHITKKLHQNKQIETYYLQNNKIIQQNQIFTGDPDDRIEDLSPKKLIINKLYLGKNKKYFRQQKDESDRPNAKRSPSISKSRAQNSQQILSTLEFLQLIEEESSKSKSLSSRESLKSHYDQNSIASHTKFKVIYLSEKEQFVGFTKPLNFTINANQADIQASFDGIGFILYDNFPRKYGQFVRGKLNGFGRSYQTQLNIADGIFLENKLAQGFIIDYFNKKSYFGHQKKERNAINIASKVLDKSQKLNKSSKKKGPKDSYQESLDYFNIIAEFPSSNLEQMYEYKKYYHLKSLNLINGYFQLPKIAQISVWPQVILHKLQNNKIVSNVLNNFHPQIKDMDLSQIQRIVQSSENRVQRQIINQMIASHTKDPFLLIPQNNSHQKNQSSSINEAIKRHLSKNPSSSRYKQNDFKKEIFQDQILQYQRLSRQKSRKQLNEIDSQNSLFGKTPRERKSIQSYVVQSPEKQQKKSYIMINVKSQSNIKDAKDEQPNTERKKEKEKMLKFKKLIEEYQKCETQRKEIDPSRKTAVKTVKEEQRNKSPILIESVVIAAQKIPNSSKKDSSRKSPKKRIDLDQIYTKFLKKS